MTSANTTKRGCASMKRRAFTMAEMLVAVTIMVIVTAVVASLFAQVRKMIGITQWGVETRAQLRTVAGMMAQDLENIDSKAYFLMLNRDYGWDSNQTPALPAGARAPLIYPTDPAASRRIWADRLAFITNGPFNTLQNFQIGSAPVMGTSARIYYGQSLWTHELADMSWATMAGVTPALDPFVKAGGFNGPSQMGNWTGDFSQRPAIGWNLVRQAVLHVPNTAVDYVAGNYLNVTREIDWRAVMDNEFMLLNRSLNAYTNADLAGQVDAWVQGSSNDWAALLWSPRIDTGWPAADPTAMARSRVLLPHAARVRFQLRLSDGTVVPRLDETSDNPRVRGGIASPVYNIVGNLLNPDYSCPLLPWINTTPTFVVLDPTAATDTVHPAAQPAYQVPVRQVAYIWTPNRTNVPKLGTSPNQITLYPVAVRVRIEVYDPQKRTPDPMVLDEWLPVRWR